MRLGPADEATVGDRVVFYRRRKDITQEVLARLPGRSTDRIAEVFIHTQTERWSRLGLLLPDLIADAWHATCTTTGEPQRRPFGQLALVWHVTAGMLDRIGEQGLPWIAAERTMTAAECSADDLLIAAAAWRLAVVLRHSGRLQESLDVPLATADALRPHLTRSPQRVAGRAARLR